VWFVKKEEIEKNSEIENAFQKIKNQTKIGSQYEWISKFCFTNNLTHVELCIEKNIEKTSVTIFLKNNYLNFVNSEIEKNDRIKILTLFSNILIFL